METLRQLGATLSLDGVFGLHVQLSTANPQAFGETEWRLRAPHVRETVLSLCTVVVYRVNVLLYR